MDGDTGSGLRHWLNGTRDIKLHDLLKLCTVTNADPAVILFGGPCISIEDVIPAQREAFRAGLDALLGLTRRS